MLGPIWGTAGFGAAAKVDLTVTHKFTGERLSFLEEMFIPVLEALYRKRLVPCQTLQLPAIWRWVS